ncbi:conserved hypothetical protein [Culex quinquefasciatus]|uniref:Uncharacterized protein n=1 Tax=Culex quinquefasciatus TaxID=7176 RepID=B0WY74_CULQU|nr:conserved hypothetical protein [Culex quinquefasciatus]|eukprot:XP_001862346.1 conserved hypothetical protein [Culex quinquefasciatus]
MPKATSPKRRHRFHWVLPVGQGAIITGNWAGCEPHHVNGGWSQWSAWLECRCPGKPAQGRKRTRTCSDPIPLYGGAPCVGPNQQKTADCVTCPVNGGWSQWSAWLECRCPGKPAQGRKRTRTCSDPIPLYGGAPCVGPNQQKTADCVTCPELAGTENRLKVQRHMPIRRWSTWSTWSDCTAKCVQVRRRVCRTQSLEYYDKTLVKHHQQLVMDDGVGGGPGQDPDQSSFGCHGKDMQTIVCRGGDCEIDDTVRRWSTWSTWSDCTAKCVQVRRRVCRTQSLEYYDKTLVKHHQQLVMDDGVGGGPGQDPDQSSFGCHGKDMQTIVCRGGDCEIDDTAPHLQTKTRNKDVAATAELSRLNVNKKMCADKNRAKINAANGGIVMDESSIRLLC